jgi:2-polyprenyl-6-methoxyphenol hydroxylase-like FAD-dependent oxidoreductase
LRPPLTAHRLFTGEAPAGHVATPERIESPEASPQPEARIAGPQAPGGSAAALLALQRSAGNRAVGRLLARRRVLQRAVGPTLAAGTPVWIHIDQQTRARGRLTSGHIAHSNSYMVEQLEDVGSGVTFDPGPHEIHVSRLDPVAEQAPSEPKTRVPKRETRGLTVAVIGGGPTGLLAAIEAMRQGATRVTVYEGRSEPYSRRNVPTLNQATMAKLAEVGVSDELFGWRVVGRSPGYLASDGSGQVPLLHLEEALTRRAVDLGIRIIRGSKPRSIRGDERSTGSRAAAATLEMTGTITQYRHEERGNRVDIWAETVPVPTERADLVILAVGAGASDDPFVTETLGIRYKRLKARDYGFYGLFEHAATTPYELQHYVNKVGTYTGLIPPPKRESPQHFDQLRRILQPGNSLTAFETPGLDYILGFLSGITQDEFEALRVNRTDSEEVKASKRKNLRKLAEHVALRQTGGLSHKFEALLTDDKAVDIFEVKVAQAMNLVSPHLPAVVIGDAAATPHPQVGSGLNTGVASLDALGTLVRNLSQGRQSDEAFALYQNAVGHITSLLAIKAIIVMAGAFAHKVRRLFPPEVLRFWRRWFKKMHGADWDAWLEARLSLATRIGDTARRSAEAGNPDYSALDIAWQALDEIYEAIQEAYGGSPAIEQELATLDTLK